METKDTVVDQVQALVEKIKRLENDIAQTDRLRKCNAELRKTFGDQCNQIEKLKQQKLKTPCADPVQVEVDIPLIDIADGEGAVIGDPLQIAEVLQVIFQHMEKSQLLQCRLISKFWNSAAISVITMYHPPCFRLLAKEGYQVTSAGSIKQMMVKDLEEWTGIFKNSAAPQVLMTTLVTNGATLSLAKPQAFLREFGGCVKSILIKDCRMRISLMKPLLTVWCGNAVDLKIEVLETLGGNQVANFASLTTSLERLDIDAPHLSVSNVTRRNASILIDVIKSSPNLVYLKMCGNDEVSTKVIQKLKELSDISTNLREIFISTEDGNAGLFSPLKMFRDVKVGDNMKKLTLSFVNSVDEIEFFAVLHDMSTQLQQLSVLGTDLVDQESNVKLGKDLPLFLQLKVCKYLATNWFHLSFRDVLLKMPNLENLVLAGNHDDFQYNGEFKTDEFFSNAKDVPHKNLKQLLIAGTMKEPTTTIKMSRMFPNLEKLYICIEISSILTHSNDMDYLYARNRTEKNDQIKSFFEGLANLKKIKKLFISFENFEWPVNLDYVTAFEELVNLPCLHTLVLINGDDGGFPTVNFTQAVLSLLRKCNGLRVLELVNFKMRLPDTIILLSQLDSGSTKLLKFKDRLSTEDLVDWIVQKF